MDFSDAFKGVRDRFLELKAIEQVMVALNDIITPVKNPDPWSV
jgi:hypothetical protein